MRSRAIRVGAAALAALLLLCVSARAQTIVVVDMERVMREAAAAAALREIEGERRRALRAELDALQRSLEAEEAELTELRETTPRAEFDRRVRAFDQRVREARRRAQEAAEALQSRFAEASEALRAAADPLLDAVMAERGAVLAIEREQALRVGPGVDVTDALIARLDAAAPADRAVDLLPPAEPFAPPPPAMPADPPPPPGRPADRP